MIREMIIFTNSVTPVLLLSLFGLLIIANEAAPAYSDRGCSNASLVELTPTFQDNLNALLSSLPSNATTLHDGFYRTTVGGGAPDAVSGLFLCRGDVNATVCQDCVTAAAKGTARLCPNRTESIIWFNECMLRFTNMSSFNNIIPSSCLCDLPGIATADRHQFDQSLASMLNDLAVKAANSPTQKKKFATAERKLPTSKTLYGLAQCTPDLSTFECIMCFKSAIGGLPMVCGGKQGARALLPGCNIRYELYPFYSITSTSTATMIPAYPSGSRHILVVFVIVAPAAVFVVFFILGYCYLRGRRSKIYNTTLEDNVGSDLIDIETPHFDLATIEAATNGFSDEMKIGQGGFGVVYQGTLPNGQRIAVKRLSESSLQGEVQFRNEARLIAKLQHRNLVRLLAICSEGQEKILVYDYIPNKSLDHFLFDPEKKRDLDWSRRYQIIVGIARGILYLHEDSQIRIIHCDLKANNVLLDVNMNAKISDFGLAKIFNVDQTQVYTRNVAGTFGYMSPEYGMHGKFSVKSDVFSFGVLVLEIAWRNWMDQTPLELLDPTLGGSYSKNEVIRCIHIGLLCVQEIPADRPSMNTVALMLNSYSVTSPSPRQPASFLCRRTLLNGV